MHEFDAGIGFDRFLCFIQITQICDDRFNAILWKDPCYQFLQATVERIVGEDLISFFQITDH
jgi:hypothetical protein